MIIVFDPRAVVFASDLDMCPFEPEYHVDPGTFARRAHAAAAAVVVLGDGVGNGSASPRVDRCQSGRARLQTLVRAVGPAPVVVLSGTTLDCMRLRRVPVDVVLPQTNVHRLPEVLTALLTESPRLRLADAVEVADDLGLPEPVRLAFANALRGEVIGNCPALAATVYLAVDSLRQALLDSPAGHNGRRLKWFVDAAIVMRASEMAATGAIQLRAALELGMTGERLARTCLRVLGAGWRWSELKEPGNVAREIWSNLILKSTDIEDPPENDGYVTRKYRSEVAHSERILRMPTVSGLG